MKKQIKTRQQLIERLNNIDRKCIDECLHFHDLKTLYESKEHKLSSRDKADIKKVAAIEDDPETLKAYIDSKAVEEDLEEDFDNDVIEYKGYYIEHGFYGGDEYTVQYDGDDVEFNSVEDAKQFIDEVSEDDLYEDINRYSDNKITGNTWQEFISNIEAQTKYDVDSSYKRRPEKWIELINKETGDIFDAEVTKYFDGSYELMLYNVTPKYESLNETILSPEDEYDYFAVYEGDKLIGEYPTYDAALEAADIGLNDWLYKNYGIYADDLTDDDYERARKDFDEKGKRVINGVVQYGGDEFEETPLNEDAMLEAGLSIIPFEYYIYFDGEALSEESFEYERDNVFKDADDNLHTFLNSDLVKNKVNEKLGITIEDIEFVDYLSSSEDIQGLLNVYIAENNKVSIENLFEVLNNLVYKWNYNTTITIQGSKRDVDDWDEWEADLNAVAELDYSE